MHVCVCIVCIACLCMYLYALYVCVRIDISLFPHTCTYIHAYTDRCIWGYTHALYVCVHIDPSNTCNITCHFQCIHIRTDRLTNVNSSAPGAATWPSWNSAIESCALWHGSAHAERLVGAGSRPHTETEGRALHDSRPHRASRRRTNGHPCRSLRAGRRPAHSTSSSWGWIRVQPLPGRAGRAEQGSVGSGCPERNPSLGPVFFPQTVAALHQADFFSHFGAGKKMELKSEILNSCK